MHSNVVALRPFAETRREVLPLIRTTLCIQRAVVEWADLRSPPAGGSVLKLIERPSLMTDLSLLYQRIGATLVDRFVGAGITALHRAIAEDLVREAVPLTPLAHSHTLASRRELRSVVLPFMEHDGSLVVLFESG